MDFEFFQENKAYQISLQKEGQNYFSTFRGETIPVNIQWIDENSLSLIIKNRSFLVYLTKNRSGIQVSVNGEYYCFSSSHGAECSEPSQKAFQVGGDDKLSITAPMPGNVLKIHVKEGDHVEEGDCLAIVEAMKMETDLHSLQTARVKQIFVQQGQQVDAGAIIIELEALE